MPSLSTASEPTYININKYNFLTNCIFDRGVTCSQVSSMESITKKFRYLIDDQRLIIILCGRIGIDGRQYQPYFPVSESASTVAINRDRSSSR